MPAPIISLAQPSAAEPTTTQPGLLPQEACSLPGELERILSEQLLTPYFMPIVDSRRGVIVGYEALIRGPLDSPLHTPAGLFPCAQRAGRLLPLELECRRLAITRFRELALPGLLFLNVTPNTLLEPDFRSGATQRLMARQGLAPERLVLEITEQLPITDYALMREATQHYRRQGFQVALDDLGAGYAGLRSWSELRPQYVKIDRHFIDGIDHSAVKQAFVRSIMEVAHSIDCRVIAEGVEQAAEHHYLNAIGLNLQQGFYFAPPLPMPLREPPPQLQRAAPPAVSGNAPDGPLARLAQPLPTLKPERTLGEAARRFRKTPGLRAIAVLQQGRPVGLLHRDICLGLCLAAADGERYAQQAVRAHLDGRPLILEAQHSLAQIARELEQQDLSRLRSDFIITRSGEYLGLGSVAELLKRLAQG